MNSPHRFYLTQLIVALVLLGCGGDRTENIQLDKPNALLSASAEKFGYESSKSAARAKSMDLISNGTFESGAFSWSTSPDAIVESPKLALNGTFIAALGGKDNAKDYIQQDMQLPANADSLQLQFAVGIGTDEHPDETHRDILRVDIFDLSNGEILLHNIGFLSNKHAHSSWKRSLPIDLTPHRGKKIRIKFSAETDDSLPTLFLIDDVQLLAQINNEIQLNGYQSDFTISPDASGGAIIVDKRSRDAAHYFQVSRIVFKDVVAVYDLESPPTQLYRLYQAAFNRAPDLAGLGHWIGLHDQKAITVEQAAEYFMKSEEFRRLYGEPDDGQFVTLLYSNVLHRKPDTAGFTFHVNNLQRGAVSRAVLLLAFSESAENIQQIAPSIREGFRYTTQTTKPPACPANSVWSEGNCVAQTVCSSKEELRDNICVPRPHIYRVTPEGGARPDSTSIVFNFMQYVADGSVTATLSSATGQSVPLSLQSTNSRVAGYSASFFAQPALSENTVYTVTVSGKARSPEGVLMDKDFSWGFTTICNTGRILDNGKCIPKASLVCAAPKIAFDGQCVDSLPTCSAIQKRVNGFCVDACTAPLVYANTCKSADILPKVHYVTPAEGQSVMGYPAKKAARTVTVYFDKLLDNGGKLDLAVIDERGQRVAGAVSYSKGAAEFTTADSRGLLPGKYRARVSGYANYSDNLSADPYEWTFEAYPGFLVRPDNGAQRHPFYPAAEFDTEIDGSSITPDSLVVRERDSGRRVEGRLITNGNTLYFNSTENYTLDQWYTATLARTVRTVGNLPRNADTTWSFTGYGPVTTLPVGGSCNGAIRNSKCDVNLGGTPGTGTGTGNTNPGTGTGTGSGGTSTPGTGTGTGTNPGNGSGGASGGSTTGNQDPRYEYWKVVTEGEWSWCEPTQERVRYWARIALVNQAHEACSAKGPGWKYHQIIAEGIPEYTSCASGFKGQLRKAIAECRRLK